MPRSCPGNDGESELLQLSRASFDDVRSPRDGAARGTSPLRGEVDLLARSQRNTLYAAEASIRQSLPALLARLDAEVLCDCGKSRALLFNRLAEFRRPANIEDLAGCDQAGLDAGVGHGADVRCNALAQLHRHARRAEVAHEAIKGELGMAGFGRSGD